MCNTSVHSAIGCCADASNVKVLYQPIQPVAWQSDSIKVVPGKDVLCRIVVRFPYQRNTLASAD